MSKFACKCGDVIRFNVVPSRYDGEVLRDTGSDAVYDDATDQVADFIAAIQAGRRDEWLHRFYGSESPIKDDEAIADILDRHLGPFTLGIHQCERCGRLWLQRPRQNYFSPYQPEGEWRGALETPAEDFLGYVEGQDFYGARIEGVRQERGAAWVTLFKEGGVRAEVAFTGVTAVRIHDGATAKPVRFLSEWADVPPLRRFLFDSTDQRSELLVEVTAREVRLSPHFPEAGGVRPAGR